LNPAKRFMTPRKIELVKDLLRKTYGLPARSPLKDPLDELIQTILSQNTTDQNSQRAFLKLKENFSTWEDVLKGRTEAIARAIHSGGLAEIKSQRIQKVLRTIREREGRLSLKRVCSMPVNEALVYLTDLEGVGIKTACCVLLFACGKPVMPVDTHVYRVSQRLGWIAGSVSIEKAHEELHKIIPNGERYAMHVLLIRHGRQTCHALRPACDRCALSKYCPTASSSGNGTRQFKELTPSRIKATACGNHRIPSAAAR